MRTKYDELWIGLLTGVLVPFVGYAVLLLLYQWADEAGLLDRGGLSYNFRERTLALIAVALNLIPLSYFQRKYANRSVRGLVTATVIMAFIWFFYYGRELLR